jgi:fatty acid desaturase
MDLTDSDYAKLRKELECEGLLNNTPAYYSVTILVNLVLLISMFVVLIFIHKWYMVILMALPISFICVQFAYLGHDAGHWAISRKKIVNNLVGYFCHSLILGGSFNYWKYKHNAHHANPNHEELDPDLQQDPFSFYKGKTVQKKGFRRLLTRYQSFLLPLVFFFVMFLMRYDSMSYMWRNKRESLIDFLLMIANFLLFIGLAAYFIGIIKAIVLYIMIYMLIGFYMGMAFTPNHVGMKTFDDAESTSYFTQQVLSSRNIKGGKLLTIILGGLNYQIEHHLFPQVSRKNLPGMKQIIKEFCNKTGISYTDDTLSKAWKDIFVYLNEVGKHDRKFPLLKVASNMVQ